MDYTLEQLEDIAILKESFAYKEILKQLKEEIEYTSVCMEQFEHNIDIKLLPYWKSLKKIVFLLETYPETVAHELQEYRNNLLKDGMEDILMRKPSPQQLRALKALYEKKKENLKEVV